MSEQNSKSGIMKITLFPLQPHRGSIDLGFLGILQKDTLLWTLLCSLIEMTIGVKGQAITPPSPHLPQAIKKLLHPGMWVSVCVCVSCRLSVQSHTILSQSSGNLGRPLF